jgi:hypothetical protein
MQKLNAEWSSAEAPCPDLYPEDVGEYRSD